jgi:hypothetical protein
MPLFTDTQSQGEGEREFVDFTPFILSSNQSYPSSSLFTRLFKVRFKLQADGVDFHLHIPRKI